MKSITQILKEMEETGEIKTAESKLRVEDLNELKALDDDVFNLISKAFAVGYYRGVRAEKNKQRKVK